MKLFNKILLSAAVVASSLTMGSCAGDMDLLPTDPRSLTSEKFATDPAAYMQQLMADVYLQYATYGVNGNASVQKFDGGMSTFQRACFILEELCTDETDWLASAGDRDYGDFHFGIVPTNNTALMGTYSRLFINIALCNQFIQTVNDGYFNIQGNAELESMAAEFIRQAHVLRAGAYWYAIDCFGNVPYLDENTEMGQIGPQLGRAEVYNRVVTDLEAIVDEYKSIDPNQKAAYGYVGLDVAEAILVKFYLNAEVYTGTPAWDKCLEHSTAIINRLKGPGFQGSGLCNYYHQNFAYSNKAMAIGGANAVNEIIWTIPQDQPNLLSYANGTFMLNGFLATSTKGVDTWEMAPGDYNAGSSGWKCMTAREQFSQKFEWNADYTYSPDQRTALWRTAAHGFSISSSAPLDQDNFGNNGFIPLKFTNFALDEEGQIDRANSPAPTDQLGLDCPIIRLAEIYLSGAEAALHTNQGGIALEYTNYVRERAGMPKYDVITLQELQEERCRELYCENVRRSDLIRYGKWISGYNWSWKNKQVNGGDFDARFVLYPLPSPVVSRNGYTQNPGY